MSFQMPDVDDYYGRITAIQKLLIPGAITLESFETDSMLYPWWAMDIDETEEITFDNSYGKTREFTLDLTFTMFLVRSASEGILIPHSLSKQIARDVVQVMVGWVNYSNLVIPDSATTAYQTVQQGFVSGSTTITTQGSVEINTPSGFMRGSQFTLSFNHVVEREINR